MGATRPADKSNIAPNAKRKRVWCVSICTVGATETSPSLQSAARRSSQSPVAASATQPAAIGIQTGACGRSSGKPAMTWGELNATKVSAYAGVVQPCASDFQVACAGRASLRARRAASFRLQRTSASSRHTKRTPIAPARPINEPTAQAANAGGAKVATLNCIGGSARSKTRAQSPASPSNAS